MNPACFLTVVDFFTFASSQVRREMWSWQRNPFDGEPSRRLAI